MAKDDELQHRVQTELRAPGGFEVEEIRFIIIDENVERHQTRP